MDIHGNGDDPPSRGPHLLRGPATNLRSDGQVAAFPRRDNDQLKRFHVGGRHMKARVGGFVISHLQRKKNSNK